jgi:hypothetical protein
MSDFRVYSGVTLVGTSSLEQGDPPMGVAFGSFIPAPGYSAIQNVCRENHKDQSSLQLTVRTPSGEIIRCEGIAILEGSGDIELHVLGISQPPYADLFPQHLAFYESHFKRALTSASTGTREKPRAL